MKEPSLSPLAWACQLHQDRGEGHDEGGDAAEDGAGAPRAGRELCGALRQAAAGLGRPRVPEGARHEGALRHWGAGGLLLLPACFSPVVAKENHLTNLPFSV